MRTQLYVLREAVTSRGSLAASLRDTRLPPHAHSWLDRRWAAVNWLCAAQDACGGRGLSYGYHVHRGWQPAYPETTGYAIPTLLEVAIDGTDSLDRRVDLERRSHDLALWLVDVQLPSGAIGGGTVTRLGPPTVFNTAQVLDGFCAAGRRTGDSRILDAAAAAGRWLLNMQDDDGCWRQGLSGLTLQTPATYNARSAAVLYRTGDLLDEPRFRAAAVRNAAWVMSQQRDNGWFENNCVSDNERPLTHTIGYTLEGLLDLALLSGDDRILAAVARGSEQLALKVREDGWLSGRFDAGWQPCARWSCLTGSSQLAAVWFRLGRHLGRRDLDSAASRLLGFVKRTQRVGGRVATDPTIGGIKGSHPIWGRYDPFVYPNWASKFFLDALREERHSRWSQLADPETPGAQVSPATPSALAGLRLEYVVEIFPAWLMAEIKAMRAQGALVRLSSAFRPPTTPDGDPERRALLAECAYFPLDYRGVARANVEALLTRPVAYFGALSWLVRQRETLRFLVLGAYLAKQAREAGVNHLHGMFGTRTTTLAFVMSQLSDIPFSFSTHAYDLFNNNQSLVWKTHRAAFMRTISTFNARYLGDAYPGLDTSRVRVVHLGVELTRFAPAARTLPPPLRVICIGNLLLHKGQQILIEASAALTSRGVAHEVHIIGTGPSEPYLKQLVADRGVAANVVFVPSCPHAEIAARLSASHVCVLPCLDMRGEGEHVDGIPVVLMEAMAAGLPVVSTPVSGNPELIEHGVSGILVRQRDAADLANALQALASDHELRDEMGRAARARVVSHFDLHTNTGCLGRLMLKHVSGSTMV